MKIDRLAGAANLLGEPIECVVDACSGAGDVGCGIFYGLLDSISRRIQCELGAVAEIILNGHESLCIVVSRQEEAAVRKRRLGDVTDAVVLEGGQLPAHIAAEELAPRIVGERGDESVRIFQRERPTVRVIGRDAVHVTEGVGSLGKITSGVVCEGRDVGDVRPRTVACREEPLGVVGVGRRTVTPRYRIGLGARQ